MNNKVKTGVFIGLIAVSGSLAFVSEIKGKTKADVLYYPDGQPVRNYEQLGLYLDEQIEVK